MARTIIRHKQGPGGGTSSASRIGLGRSFWESLLLVEGNDQTEFSEAFDDLCEV